MTIKNSYVDPKNESKVIAQGANYVGGLIGQGSSSPNTIEKSGIYQGIISSNGQAGKTIFYSLITYSFSKILPIYLFNQNFYIL